jgi:hypothetical protein
MLWRRWKIELRLEEAFPQLLETNAGMVAKLRQASLLPFKFISHKWLRRNMTRNQSLRIYAIQEPTRLDSSLFPHRKQERKILVLRGVK